MDRSSPDAGAALFRDGVLAGVCRDSGGASRAPDWMVNVAGLLAEHGVAPAGLEVLCAGVGPGSFSGIRSSLAALLGMGLPSGVAVFGVSSAAALAFRLLTAADAPAGVSVVGDARRERLWIGSFRLATAGGVAVIGNDGRMRPVRQSADDFELVRWGEVASVLPAGTRVVSPDFGRIGAALTAAFGPERVLQTPLVADAVSVGRLFLAAPDGARADARPVYLHPAVVEKAGYSVRPPAGAGRETEVASQTW